MTHKYGTPVTTPKRDLGGYGFIRCIYCNYNYTALGISKHWPKCSKNPNREVSRKK